MTLFCSYAKWLLYRNDENILGWQLRNMNQFKFNENLMICLNVRRVFNGTSTQIQLNEHYKPTSVKTKQSYLKKIKWNAYSMGLNTVYQQPSLDHQIVT